MKLTIDIWAKNKDTGSFHIADKIIIDESDIEDYAIEKYKGKHFGGLRDNFEYSARIDKTEF